MKKNLAKNHFLLSVNVVYCCLFQCKKKQNYFGLYILKIFLTHVLTKKNQPHRASINCERSFSRTLVKALLFTVCFVCVQAESLVNLYWTGLSD